MKILVILPRFPYPLEKGDKLRAYHQIRVLSVNNEVYLFALSHNRVGKEEIEQLSKYCREIRIEKINKLCAAFRVLCNFFSIKSLQIGYWYSKKAHKMYRKFENEVNPDVVYAQMVRTMKYASHSRLPKVLDFQDALSMNQGRRMMNHSGLRYFFMHYEFKMLRSAEFNACSIFDRLTIISETDREAIPQHRDTTIDIVRNGVDFEYFHSLQTEKKYDIVFCGNMQYKPNIDAARYLVNDIMPIVWRSHPKAKVVLAGATPTLAVRQLASDRITVTGTVDDIRPFYAQSKVFIAPMRIGSGLQNKLLEAMSMQIPCITTPLANDSLGANDGEQIMIGRDAGQLAAAIIRLLDDQGFATSLSENALHFVRHNFSWDAAGADLEKVLKEAVRSSNNSSDINEEIELEDE
ncbi:MAG: glycosyltransferase [Bacteroidales bacterium]|nr:glycosyltransferase [Bacteroidales bacterium]